AARRPVGRNAGERHPSSEGGDRNPADRDGPRSTHPIGTAALLAADRLRRRLWPGLCAPPTTDGWELPELHACADCPRMLRGTARWCRPCWQIRRRVQNREKERRRRQRETVAQRQERWAR